jgi:hypothetical protein
VKLSTLPAAAAVLCLLSLGVEAQTPPAPPAKAPAAAAPAAGAPATAPATKTVAAPKAVAPKKPPSLCAKLAQPECLAKATVGCEWITPTAPDKAGKIASPYCRKKPVKAAAVPAAAPKAPAAAVAAPVAKAPAAPKPPVAKAPAAPAPAAQ